MPPLACRLASSVLGSARLDISFAVTDLADIFFILKKRLEVEWYTVGTYLTWKYDTRKPRVMAAARRVKMVVVQTDNRALDELQYPGTQQRGFLYSTKEQNQT